MLDRDTMQAQDNKKDQGSIKHQDIRHDQHTQKNQGPHYKYISDVRYRYIFIFYKYIIDIHETL